jgi:hypothetical protein
MLQASQVRACFEPVASARQENTTWNDILLLFFDVWNHVDRDISAHARSEELKRQLFLSLEMSRAPDASQASSYAWDASTLLTSIKAFLGEF